MLIEIKNLKSIERLSDETLCFYATVYLDGKRAGEVSNTGEGAENDYHPLDLYHRLSAYADTLPNEMVNNLAFPQSPDSLISHAIHRAESAKQLRSLMLSKVVFTKANERGIFTVKPLRKNTLSLLRVDTDESEALKAKIKSSLQAAILLNSIPFSDALKLFIADGDSSVPSCSASDESMRVIAPPFAG